MIVVALLVAGKLATRRGSGQEMEDEGLAASIRWWCPEVADARAILHVEDRKRQGFAVHTIPLDGISGIRMHEKICLDRLLATKEALTDEVLLQFARFTGKYLRNAFNAVVLQRGEAAEMQFTLFHVGLPDALVLNRQKQAALVCDTNLPEQQGAQQGQRINAGEGHLGTGQGRQPGSESLLVGECGEHDALVSAPGFFMSERDRCGQ